MTLPDAVREKLKGALAFIHHEAAGGIVLLAAAIAALLARDRPLPQAVHDARLWLQAAIEAGQGLGIGHGRGPVHHFHQLWPCLEERS